MKIAVFWFRRDLRMEDNRGLQAALSSGHPVLPLFIFDSNILEELPADDPRVTFIYSRIEKIHHRLRQLKSSLVIRYGDPVTVWKEITRSYQISEVHVNKDYEPYASERDRKVDRLLQERGIAHHRHKDQVIFEEDEITKKDGSPYTVFTPYRRRWTEMVASEHLSPAAPAASGKFLDLDHPLPGLSELGFTESNIKVPPYDLSGLDQYSEKRDFPSLDATSHLSPHLRFGTVSIRKIFKGLEHAHDAFRSELIWREFFMQILHHFPHVVDRNFNARFNGIAWRNDSREFDRWCRGETGYPMVDAGMRQLNETGVMHNRVRMITASFLCKHLLIDWRWGEAYFAGKLLDYELSSNNGNWQWAAGTGCDAVPYFRIFNPHEQLKRFDSRLEYVRKWIPGYREGSYIEPMVDHSSARERALQTYKAALEGYLPG